MNIKKLFLPFTITLIVIALLSSACKKKKQEEEINPEPQITNFPGLGNNSGTPTGTQFVLPSFVRIIGDINGGIPYKGLNIIKDKQNNFINFSSLYDSIGQYAVYSTGTYVDIVAKFASTLDHDTTLLIPAGLIFIDETGGSQNGFILQNVVIPLQKNDTAWAFIKTYCLNASRHISYDSTIYKISVITDNPQLLEVVNIMKTKQPPIDKETGIQSVLWDISDYYGITNEDRDYLNSLQ